MLVMYVVMNAPLRHKTAWSESKSRTTRRKLVAEATRRSSDLILKESFLSQVLLPTMHEIVDDVQDVFNQILIICFLYFMPSLLMTRK